MPRDEAHVKGHAVDAHLVRVRPVSGPPVVLVPGLGAGPLHFDLHEHQSLVERLHRAGRTPWLLDFNLSWRARDQDAGALLYTLREAMAALSERSGFALNEIDAIGHSLGGILLLALAAEGLPLRSLVALASGLDYRLGRSPLPRALSLSPKGIGPLRIGARWGGLPVQRLSAVAARLFGRGANLPIERDQFHPGSTPGSLVRQVMRGGVRDMPLALLLDLADLFTEEGLRLGTLELPLKEAVARLGLPVLLVAAAQDTQCPVTAVRDAASRIPGARLIVVGDASYGYGHVDLLTASRAPEEVFAPALAFLEDPTHGR